MCVLVERVHQVASQLVSWSGRKFTNFSKQIQEIEKRLVVAQVGYLIEEQNLALNIQGELDDLLIKQEAYWHLRSRVS